MNILLTVLHSYSQVFLQNNTILGALIMIGLAIASPIALLASLVGVSSSLILALSLKIPKHTIESGLYGFNGLLIGVVASIYIKQFPTLVIVTILAAALSTLIFYIFSKNHLTAFTFPFVLLAWVIVLSVKHFR